MNKKIKAGIIGGAGYTGGELIRVLLRHPSAGISFVQSKSNAGRPVSAVHEDLLGETSLVFSEKHHPDIDVLFICSGHGEAKSFISENDIDEKIKIIDLSHDFRLAANSEFKGRRFIYGLPELNRSLIETADNIANPGCFATAIQLGLLPLASLGLLNDIYTTGITGSTGAGQSHSATSHFSWRVNNIQPYKSFTHQHVNEILESLVHFHPSNSIALNFIPWRGDFTRGIFISSQLQCRLDIDELYDLFETFYRDHPFIYISREPIHLKQVVNTNKCNIQLEKEGNSLVVHSAIDNLLKGAAGQAVQNMNLMFSLAERAGLELKANYF
jgi:N-acetyl-gamma-glutamyl-phosphate reductase